MTGVAVHDSLAEFGIESDIKWVNDVHVDGRKISGILAEATETDLGVAVVVGIGINMNSESFPPYLSASSTSLAEETGGEVKRDDLIGSLTRQLNSFYEVLNGEDGPSRILEHWRERSSYYTGKNVRVVLNNDTIYGVTAGLEANGALRVQTNDGNIAVIQAGEVEQLRPTD
jgi:BirA family biotin operon repressor/biotin-[acetyl-CoA-carboxylase] ligase